MPECRLIGGAFVPDVARIDPARWREVLIPLSGPLRTKAVLAARLGPATSEALDLAWGLPPAPSEAARSVLPSSPGVPMPEVSGTPQRERQVNFRVAQHEYDELEVAARLLGGRPSQVARMLVLGGVRRYLAEHDAALDRIRWTPPTPPAR